MPADLNDYFNKNNKGGNGGGGDKPQRPKRPKKDTPDFLNEFGKKTGVLYTIIGIIVLFVIAKPYVVINSGEVGIKATAGEYDKDPLRPGFHVFLPFVQQVMVVDTKVRSINYISTKGHDMSNVPSK